MAPPGAEGYTALFGLLRVALKFETRKNHSNVQYYNWLIVELFDKIVNPYPYPISLSGPQRHQHQRRW